MLKNDRKRSRKSKQEVRKDAEFEERAIQYNMQNGESSHIIIKEEIKTEIDDYNDSSAMLTYQENQSADTGYDPIKYIATTVDPSDVDNQTPMEFSVMIKVEEFEETDTTVALRKPVEQVETTQDLTSTVDVEELKSAVKSTEDDPQIDSNTETGKPNELCDQNQELEFKEYIANNSMILKAADRLAKSEQIPDRLLAVIAKNYAGRILDEPVKDPRDVVLSSALEKWQEWANVFPGARDSPLLYKCYICGQSWWYLYDYREHIPKHMHLSTFSVSLEVADDECSMVCFLKDIVYNDIKYPDTNCYRCGRQAKIHMFATYSPYKCLYCGKRSLTCTEMLRHEGVCNERKNTRSYKCRVCLIFFYSESKLIQHIINLHRVRSDMVVPWDSYTCGICSRAFILPNLHVCVKKVNNYGCNFCGRSFQKKIFKKIHVANYNMQVDCRICRKTLMSRCMEYTHMVQHTDRFALMYKCTQCIEGRYYPDEFSIMHHTSVVHEREFERKFKYLEMVILPKQCLEKSPISSVPTLRVSATEPPPLVPITPVEKARVTVTSSTSTDTTPTTTTDTSTETTPTITTDTSTDTTCTTPTTTTEDLPVVVVKQEPPCDDPDGLCVLDLACLKTEIEVEHFNSLQDLITLKTEAVEEVFADDLIVIENKSETVVVTSDDSDQGDISDNSDNGDSSVSRRRRKKGERLQNYKCGCGFTGSCRELREHRRICSKYLQKRLRKAQTVPSKRAKSGENCQERNGDKKSAMYICKCKEEFSSSGAYKRHRNGCGVHLAHQLKDAKRQALHRKTMAVYRCTKCDRSYENIQQYARHFYKIHSVRRDQCPQCFEQFDSSQRLSSHIQVHVTKNYVKTRFLRSSRQTAKGNACKECQAPVDQAHLFKHWEQHLQLNPPELVVKEEPLDEECEGEGQLVVDIESPNTESLYSPEEMKDALDWLQTVLQYGSRLRRNSAVRACVFCARRFQRQNDCKRHVIEHLLADAYARKCVTRALRCQICGEEFVKGDKYKFHMRKHAALPVYQCTICSKSFSDSSNFCKHRKVHNLNYLKCELCEKKFYNKNCFEKHLEMHKTTQPIICKICTKVLYTESAYKRHVRNVHEKKRLKFLCTICKEPFLRLKDKWDHMWLIHKERAFAADCPLCPAGFRRFADVKAHVRSAHDRELVRDGGALLTVTRFLTD